MGFTLVGLLLLAFAASYALLLGRGRAGRHGLLGVPSGVLARGPHGLRRPARPGAVAVPGRRQLSARRSARCSRPSSCCRAASRASPGSPLAALLGMLVLFKVGPLVQGAWPGATAARAATGQRRACARPQARAPRHRGAAGADFLEVFLPRQHHQLLHLLSDRPFPAVGAACAAAPVHLPRRRRGRHHHRRPARRPLRAQVRDLGLDPRRTALHPAAAARQPLLDDACSPCRSA